MFLLQVDDMWEEVDQVLETGDELYIVHVTVDDPEKQHAFRAVPVIDFEGYRLMSAPSRELMVSKEADTFPCKSNLKSSHKCM